MALEYKLDPNAYDSHQLSPYWVILAVRFENRKTVDLSQFKKGTKKSFNISKGVDGLAEKDPLFLDNDCTQWSISSAKQSHIASCTLSCVYNEVDYSKELVPGDWILVWLVNSEADYIALKEKINSRKRANEWKDGFKFMGRVQTVEMSKTRSATGHFNRNYQITCAGFTELDNQIFYHPAYSAHFNQDQAGMGFWLTLDKELLGLAKDSRKPLTSQTLIPKLLRILLGKPSVNKVLENEPTGSPASDTSPKINYLPSLRDYNKKNEEPTEAAPKYITDLKASPNGAYLVPDTVVKLVSDDSVRSGLFNTYDRLLRCYIGVQQYTGTNNGIDIDSILPKEAQIFLPELKEERESYIPPNWYETGNELSSQFLFLPGPFTGQSVWSIINGYVNSPVDEMYTCMRIDPTGHIMPTLMVRQTAFNSLNFENKQDQYGAVTPFAMLPRWVVPDSMIYSIKYGTSEANRINYIHIMGKDLANTTAGMEQVLAMSRNPPMADLVDISRSGLKMKMGQVNANLNERNSTNSTSPGSFWQQLVADGVMNAHLKQNGMVQMPGIVEPICEGDNLVADGMLFHIERITHSGGRSASGHKTWTTTVNVSNGIPVLSDYYLSDQRANDHFLYRCDLKEDE